LHYATSGIITPTGGHCTTAYYWRFHIAFLVKDIEVFIRKNF